MRVPALLLLTCLLLPMSPARGDIPDELHHLEQLAEAELDAEAFFEIPSFFLSRSQARQTLGEASCGDLVPFFQELAALEAFPCDGIYTDHKQVLFGAVARCLNADEPEGVAAMEALVRLELACEEPVSRVLAVLREPAQAFNDAYPENAGTPPTLGLLPDFLQAYHAGKFPSEWPWFAPPTRPPDAPQRIPAPRRPAYSTIMAYITAWNIEEPGLAAEFQAEFRETGNPRQLLSALMLADAEAFAAMIAELVGTPEVHLPAPEAQVVLKALQRLPASLIWPEDGILQHYHALPVEERQAVTRWLIGQISAAGFPSDQELHAAVGTGTDPHEAGREASHLQMERRTLRMLVQQSLAPLWLLINERQFTAEEVRSLTRREVSLADFDLVVSSETREAIRQARDGAATDEMAGRLGALVEGIEERLAEQ